MTTTNGRTRPTLAPRTAPDEPLFPETSAAYPKRAVTIHLTYHAAPVDLSLADAPVEQVEKLIDGLLQRAGWAAATPAAAGLLKAPKPPELTQEPFYDGDGAACCPIHKKPLREGQYGWHCTAKAQAPIGNDKGYCKYVWNE